MKKLLLLISIKIFSCTSIAHAEISKEKLSGVERMLRLMGMEKLTDQMTTQMISAFKIQAKEVSEAFWTKFLLKRNTRELLEKIIPLYGTYYTMEDHKAVNAF